MRTIALIQGDALGGGLELALSCHTIVAEEGVDMGLPEVLFGLFPGMGAYSFLCKRMSPQTGREAHPRRHASSPATRCTAWAWSTCWCPRARARRAVQDLIRQQQRSPHAHLAMNAVRGIAQPVGYDELMGITEVWVDTALALGEKSLRTMERIVRAQTRRSSLAA